MGSRSYQLTKAMRLQRSITRTRRLPTLVAYPSLHSVRQGCIHWVRAQPFTMRSSGQPPARAPQHPGSSYETTIPMPLLFRFDLHNKKHEVIFRYDAEKDRWYVDFEETKPKRRPRSYAP